MKNDVIVYAIVGPGADAPYIGITTHSLEERFAEHVKKDPLSECSKLGVAIRKHGADKFRIKEIYHAKSWDEACAKEKEYIEFFNSIENGFNNRNGGQGRRPKILEKTVNSKRGKRPRKFSKEKIDNVCEIYRKTKNISYTARKTKTSIYYVKRILFRDNTNLEINLNIKNINKSKEIKSDIYYALKRLIDEYCL